MAIFRYRLYAIDRLISRTVAYAVSLQSSLWSMPGALWLWARWSAGTTRWPWRAPRSPRQPLFNPVRRRVQKFVDRRFNRSRYDAARVVDGFASRLREEVDLRGLTTDLTGVVGRTLDPASLSLDPGRR